MFRTAIPQFDMDIAALVKQFEAGTPPSGNRPKYTPEIEVKDPAVAKLFTQTPGLLPTLTRIHSTYSPRVTTLLQQRQTVQNAIDKQGISHPNLQTRSLAEITQVASKPEWQVKRAFYPSYKVPASVVTGSAASSKQQHYRQMQNEFGADLKKLHVDQDGQTVHHSRLSQRMPGSSLEDNEDATATDPTLNLKSQLILHEAHKTSSQPFAVPLRFRPQSIHIPNTGLMFRSPSGKLEPSSGFLTDLTSYLFLNLPITSKRGETLQLYIPKLRNAEEVALVRDVIEDIQAQLGITDPRSVKIVLMIETYEGITQVDRMVEAAGPNLIGGVNFGRWDAFADYIKTLSKHVVCPDRADMHMETAQLVAMQQRMITVAETFNIPAEGGMSSVVLTGLTKEDRDFKIAQVVADKCRERMLGFKNAWVAQPDPDLLEAINGIFESDAKALETVEKYKTQLETIKPSLVETFTQFITAKQAAPTVSDHEIDTLAVSTVASGKQTLGEFRSILYTSLQYECAMQLGDGAANVNGQMVDKAVQEINIQLIRNWIQQDITLETPEGPKKVLDILQKELFLAKKELISRFKDNKMRGYENLALSPQKTMTVAEAIEKAVYVTFKSIVKPEALAFVTEISYPCMVSTRQREALKHAGATYPAQAKHSQEYEQVAFSIQHAATATAKELGLLVAKL